ncbi:MAG: bifunctional oligoribonuclease/PAP phosphatase NrnA [Thermodesulfovibrionales bacterium]
MKVPKAVLEAVRRSARVMIASHENPDGDALGSSIGLGLALRSLGKRVIVFNRDPVPDHYRFLPASRMVTSVLPRRANAGDLLVLLDCNSPDRAGLDPVAGMRTLVIDHHKTESSFGDVRWVERNAAATGVLVHALVKALRARLTPSIATNLYAAIALDTGTYRYRNTSAAVLRIGAELVDAGAQPHVVSEALYDSWSRARLQLFLEAVKTLRIEGCVATMCLTRKAFSASGATTADAENFSNFPRQVRGVEISVLFREVAAGQWKASIRSRGGADAAKIAERFGGGGHRNAAGYRTTGGQAKIRKELCDACGDALAKARPGCCSAKR